MRKRLFKSILATALVAILCVSGAGVKSQGFYSDVQAMALDTTHIEGLEDNCVVESVASTYSYSELRQQMVDLINQTRAEAGLGALTLDDQLSDAATYRGVHMEANGYFSHYYNKKAMPTQAVNAFGIPYNGIGENIYRFNTVGDPVTAYGLDWIVSYAHGELCNSPGHYANIVNSNFTSVGIGIYITPDTSRMYITQIFKY